MRFDLKFFRRALEGVSFSFFKLPKIVEFKNIQTDTRSLNEGDCFVAFKGEHFDGLDFIKNILDQYQNTLIIVQRELFENKKLESLDYGDHGVLLVEENTFETYRRLAKWYLKQFKGKKIAITGSSGKTTTKEFLSQILGSEFQIFASEKNYNNHVGVPKNILNITEDKDYFIFELAMSHPGEIEVLSEIISPDYGVITNVQEAHIGYFPNKEAILKEKLSIISSMSKGSILWVLEDLQSIDEVRKECHQKGIILEVLVKKKVELRGNLPDRELWIDKKRQGQTSLFSIHHEINLSICFQIAKSLSMNTEVMKKSMLKLQSPPSRLEIVSKKPIIIDDTYNANIQSMIDNIRCLWELNPNQKKIFVLGDVKELGDLDRQSHIFLGANLRRIFQGQGHKVECFFVGRSMRHAFKSSSLPQRQHFLRTDEAVQFIGSHIDLEAIYYFKASRTMEFEKIIKEMKDVLSYSLSSVG